MGFTVKCIADAIQGRVIQGHQDFEFKGISTDSRAVKGGEIFWALSGERFDGHDFVKAAREKGALGSVIQRGRAVLGIDETMVVIETDDTLHALGDFAACYRRRFDIPVVAITGSNGKTTTKEMIVAILSMARTVLKSHGNLNNLIGVPLTLITLNSTHEVGVLELGMNQRGEIARLTQIAKPSVGVITNVGPVHLEHLTSVEAVAQCKAELFQGMPSASIAVVNNDDPRITQFAKDFSGKKVTFGIDHPADVMAKNIKVHVSAGITFNLYISGETSPPFCIPMIGAHNVRNALAAAAAAVALGVDQDLIIRGLERFANLSQRQEIIRLNHNITVLNDAYNANPVSMEAALQSFSLLKGPSRGIAVLGDMLELGPQAAMLHRYLGRQVAQVGIRYLLLLGDYAQHVKEGAVNGGLSAETVVIGRNHQELKVLLEGLVEEGDWILVKGSRKMEMEKVINHLGERQ